MAKDKYPLNTVSLRQRISDENYRGSYTTFLTLAQYQAIEKLLTKTKYEAKEVWKQFFNEDYFDNAMQEISVNAASEIIQFLKREEVMMAFIRKIERNEQEQHEYEMGIDRSLDSYGR